VNNYLGKGVPNGISELIIDQDYTLLAIKRFAEGSRGFWGAVINGAKKVEQTVVEPLLGFQRSELRVFKARSPGQTPSHEPPLTIVFRIHDVPLRPLRRNTIHFSPAMLDCQNRRSPHLSVRMRSNSMRLESCTLELA